MRVFLISSVILMLLPLGSQPTLADIIENIEDLDKIPEVPKKPVEEVPLVPEIPKTPDKKTNIDDNTDGKAKSSGPKKERKSAAKHPIKLKSDGRSTFMKGGGVMILRKNVVITQDQLRLQAEEAKVVVNKDKKNKNEAVKRVEINGHVKVSKFSEDPTERIIGHGDKAIFEKREQTVRLIGNARLYKGGHLIKGKQIVYQVQTGLISVDEAQGVVQPDESE